MPHDVVYADASRSTSTELENPKRQGHCARQHVAYIVLRHVSFDENENHRNVRHASMVGCEPSVGNHKSLR